MDRGGGHLEFDVSELVSQVTRDTPLKGGVGEAGVREAGDAGRHAHREDLAALTLGFASPVSAGSPRGTPRPAARRWAIVGVAALLGIVAVAGGVLLSRERGGGEAGFGGLARSPTLERDVPMTSLTPAFAPLPRFWDSTLTVDADTFAYTATQAVLVTPSTPATTGSDASTWIWEEFGDGTTTGSGERSTWQAHGQAVRFVDPDTGVPTWGLDAMDDRYVAIGGGVVAEMVGDVAGLTLAIRSAEDGALLTTFPLVGDYPSFVAIGEGTIVAAARLANAGCTVAAVDIATLTARWTADLSRQCLAAPGSFGSASFSPDLVVLSSPTVAVLDLRTGLVLADGSGSWAYLVGDDRYAIERAVSSVTQGGDADEEQAGIDVFDARGRQLYTLPIDAWSVPATDPVESTALITESAPSHAGGSARQPDDIVARDPWTGEVLWSATRVGWAIGSARDVLVVIEPDGALLGLDAATGAHLWRHPSETANVYGAIVAADAHTAVALFAEPSGTTAHLRVIGIDLRTGAQRWELPFDDALAITGDPSRNRLVVATTAGIESWRFGVG